MGIGIGSTHYPEGQFKPERSDPKFGHNYHVWCIAGALEVIRGGEFREWLEKNRADHYTVNFANNSSAYIYPGHPLWEELKEVAKKYKVEVFPLCFGAKYSPWAGSEATDLKSFDCIRISL